MKAGERNAFSGDSVLQLQRPGLNLCVLLAVSLDDALRVVGLAPTKRAL